MLRNCSDAANTLHSLCGTAAFCGDACAVRWCVSRMKPCTQERTYLLAQAFAGGSASAWRAIKRRCAPPHAPTPSHFGLLEVLRCAWLQGGVRAMRGAVAFCGSHTCVFQLLNTTDTLIPSLRLFALAARLGSKLPSARELNSRIHHCASDSSLHDALQLVEFLLTVHRTKPDWCAPLPFASPRLRVSLLDPIRARRQALLCSSRVAV